MTGRIPRWALGLSLLLGMSAALTVVLLGYLLQIKPGYQKIEREEMALYNVNIAVVEGRAAEKSLPEFREAVRTMELELDKLIRYIPGELKSDDLEKRFQVLAEQGDLALEHLAFKPGKVVDDPLQEYEIHLTLRGEMDEIQLFTDRASRFYRIIVFDEMEMSDAFKLKARTLISPYDTDILDELLANPDP